MDFGNFFTVEMVHNGIRLTTPILFGAIAAALSSRAGILNLAIEAKMLIGAFTGLLALAQTGSHVFAIAMAGVSGAIVGILMALAHRIKVDLVIFAIGLNLLMLELSVYLMRQLFGGVGVWTPDVQTLPTIKIPIVEDIPVVGPLVSGYSALVYLAFLAAAGFGLLFRMRSGRHILAIGEEPKAALAAGVPVARLQLVSLAGAGALAAIGGSFLTVGELGLFARGMTNGAGWIAITAALLAVNRPVFLVPSALLFGFSDAIAIRLQSTTDLPQALVQLIPMLATIIVLGFVGYRTMRAKETVGLPRAAKRELRAELAARR